jgi:hypothetical protein
MAQIGIEANIDCGADCAASGRLCMSLSAAIVGKTDPQPVRQAPPAASPIPVPGTIDLGTVVLQRVVPTKG